MRYSLSAGHYAAGWSNQETLTPEEITALGIRHHATAEGPQREELLLRILRSFHNYITKYAEMIRRGHLSAVSQQPTAFTLSPSDFSWALFIDVLLLPSSDSRYVLLIRCQKPLFIFPA